MVDHEYLRRKFDDMREKQAKIFNKELTDIDRKVGECIFETSLMAMEDVAEGRNGVAMRAVSIGTGLGKSTSAYAFIAALAQHGRETGKEFSCAHIVPTVKMGIEVQEGIESLLGKGTTKLWTWCHKHKGRDANLVRQELGFTPSRVINRAEIPYAPIVILTHAFWQSEIKAGTDKGCRKYRGRPRDIIFVDEYPELVNIVATHSTTIQGLFQSVAKADQEHPWLSVLSQVVSRMNQIIQSHGQRYVPTPLISRDEVKVFEKVTIRDLKSMSDPEASEDIRNQQANQMLACIKFLQASANGCAFYSRQDTVFTAYEFDFEADPGHVLLDATADIAGLVTLNPKVKSMEVPMVHYDNLEIYHMDHPKGFRNVSKVTKRAETGEAYGAWIRNIVLGSTHPGDDVLVVTHKSVFDLHFVDPANDPNRPLDWEGRKVNTQHWGSGIGENKFRHKTHVFIFGEFYVPRNKTISEVHAWSETPLSSDLLRQAEGKRKAGDDFTPRGIYLQPYEGHLLRWAKQLSMRGAARNIDGDGLAGPMKLFTSMDRSRLIRYFDRLFPGAAKPKSLPSCLPPCESTGEWTKDHTGREGLIRILMQADKAVIGADEIERRTGIKTNHLSKEFRSESVSGVARVYGWSLLSARDMGKAGRMNYLVNTKELAKERLKAA